MRKVTNKRLIKNQSLDKMTKKINKLFLNNISFPIDKGTNK